MNKLKYKKILERSWQNNNSTEIYKDKNKLNNRVQFHNYVSKTTSHSSINNKNIKLKYIK